MINNSFSEINQKKIQDIYSLTTFKEKIIDSSKKYIDIADSLKTLLDKCSKKIEIISLFK